MEKKVTKDDYLRKKGLLPPEPLGTMFIFESNRNLGKGNPSVGGIKEVQYTSMHTTVNGRSWKEGNDWIYADLVYYGFTDSPWNITIGADEIVIEKSHSGSGFGDLWSHSTFASIDKDALEEARQKEILRIKEKYLKSITEDDELNNIITSTSRVKVGNYDNKEEFLIEKCRSLAKRLQEEKQRISF